MLNSCPLQVWTFWAYRAQKRSVLAAVSESSAEVTVEGQMDSSPEDLSALFSGDAVRSCVQAVSVFSSPGLEHSIQAGSPDPFSSANCRNKSGELSSEEPTHVTSLSDGNNPLQPTSP